MSISRKAADVEIPEQVACVPATTTDDAPEIAQPVVIRWMMCDGMDGVAGPPEPADRCLHPHDGKVAAPGPRLLRPEVTARGPRRHRPEVFVPVPWLLLPMVAVRGPHLLLKSCSPPAT